VARPVSRATVSSTRKGSAPTRIWSPISIPSWPRTAGSTQVPCSATSRAACSAETLPAIEECGLRIRSWLIWDKGNVGYHAMGAQYKPNFEAFLYAVKDQPPEWYGENSEQTIWRHRSERLGIHPTTKPVSLVSQAVMNHRPATIYDPFLGSGTTLIAAEQLDRRCFGMEIDPSYCDVIVRRFENLTGEEAVRWDG